MQTVGPSASAETSQGGNHTRALVVLTSLFFMWGFLTSLNDIIIPHLKAAFVLSFTEAMLIQFCFFTAYFVVSLPSGKLVDRIGYKSGIIIGLLTASVGCLLFYPAAGTRTYPMFLMALFILAAGITLLQVAANPYVAILGRPETASARLTLTQAFNSLGTTIGPYLGAKFILSAGIEETEVAKLSPAGVEAYRISEASAVQVPYLGLMGALILIAVLIAVTKLPKIDAATPASGEKASGSAWNYRHLVLGAIGIFVYVGGEVAIGSFLVDYMIQPFISTMNRAQAGEYVALYWFGAMVGRFLGVVAMRYVKPGMLLSVAAAAVIVLVSVAMATTGPMSMWALLSVGFFNSIMFPTIFTLAIEGLGKHTSQGSGILCMAIVGGAVIPLAQGFLADRIGIQQAFILPVLCYAYIAYYGWRGHVPSYRGVSQGAAA